MQTISEKGSLQDFLQTFNAMEMNRYYFSVVELNSRVYPALLLVWFVKVSWHYGFSVMCDLRDCYNVAIDTPMDVCSTGNVRLEQSQNNATSDSLEGRLEVCINNAWGTVCNSLFDADDAAVACSRLPGFSRQGTYIHTPM